VAPIQSETRNGRELPDRDAGRGAPCPGEPFHGGSVVLVLSRKIGEQIVVSEQGVSITVIAVKGNTIRLGITAPIGVPILRSELASRRRELLPVARGQR
jgi:carbon storage regulator